MTNYFWDSNFHTKTFIIYYKRSLIIMLKKTKVHDVHKLVMEQINDVEKCIMKFESFMRAFCATTADAEILRSLCDEVCEQESVADVSLRRMIDSFAGSSFLPSSRQEIIQIASTCDRVANKCEAFARMILLQKVKFPEGYEESLLQITSVIKVQFELLEEAISNLFDNFGAFLKDHSILDKIRDQESIVDDIEKYLYEKTYALDIGLAERMQLVNLIEHLCAITDLIENIADKIQIMLVTRKV